MRLPALLPALALGLPAAAGDVPERIEAAARRHQLPPLLVRAVADVESGLNRHAVSSKGALGVMQLMPATARRFGVTDPFDPEQSIDGGCRYLAWLRDRFGGDLRLILAAYNAGEGAVDRHDGVPPYKETREYLEKVIARLRGGEDRQTPAKKVIATAPMRLARFAPTSSAVVGGTR